MKDATQLHIRPARPEEAGLFYTPHPEEDKRLGTVGHVRMDFGRSGNEFWHTWWPRGPEELNSPVFKAELQEVVDTLRESVLKNRFAMERFCYEHGGKISGGWTQNYGYIVETEHYRYCLRCNPSPGDYNCYCTAYDLDVQRQNMARDKPLAGRVTYANGDTQEFTDTEAFLKCIRDELPYRPTTGFRYEVLTDDPSVRKQVDDIVFDLYGEENPRQLEEYQKMSKKPYYLTTAIAYTSGKPHIGNTYEIVLADAIVRYKRFQGYDVRFQTGTDEHGQKIELKAQEAGITPKEFVDGVSTEIKRIWDLMNTSYDRFIRTTDEDHEKQVQKIFKKLYDKGDIYKGHYEGMYCTPCESFWTESQLVDGKCPDCGRECKPAKEEAYFFKMSKYADRLIDYINTHPEFIPVSYTHLTIPTNSRV